MKITFNINEERLAHFLTNVRGYLGLESLKLSDVQIVDMEVRPMFDMITFGVYYNRLSNDLMAETLAEQEKVWAERVYVLFEHTLTIDTDNGRPVMGFRVKQTNGEDDVTVISRQEYVPPVVEKPKEGLIELLKEEPVISVEDRLIKLYGDQQADEDTGFILPPNMK